MKYLEWLRLFNHTYTLSLLSRIWRKLSQLSHPSVSNCSIVFIREHDRQARSCRKSFGIESAIFLFVYLAGIHCYWLFLKRISLKLWITCLISMAIKYGAHNCCYTMRSPHIQGKYIIHYITVLSTSIKTSHC